MINSQETNPLTMAGMNNSTTDQNNAAAGQYQLPDDTEKWNNS